ncbi:MAG: minichromosome maintenance protein MCM, partial [Thermoplasmata archaeon]|nr:minichromosome maintenance protein MCM [Thermoplasmata archaeon]
MEEYEYDSEAIAVADAFPDRRSLWVEYEDIDAWDPEFLGYVLENPTYAFNVAENTILDMLPADVKERVERSYVRIHLRIKGAPKDKFLDIRSIRHEHVGKYLSVSGLVKRASVIRPRLLMGMFRCTRCGATTSLKQEGMHFIDPTFCDTEQGGCGKTIGQTTFKLLPERSKYIDTQTLEMQEELEGMRGGAQPQNLTTWLEDDIVGEVFPGDRIRMNGILAATQRRRGQEKL